MLTSIGTITVQVSDQDKALAYYTQKLGFEIRRAINLLDPMALRSLGIFR